MDDTKITIIEGPTPTFEIVFDVWANGIADSSTQAAVALTKLRTFNSHSLVERCYKAWSNKDPINLEFRATDGLKMEVPILAARATESHEGGDLLLLWVRLPEDEIEFDFLTGDEDEDDIDFGDDEDLEGDDDFDLTP
jgi:hypothetical protein